MKLRLEQFCPMVFPPGAGGHFFWDLMSMHPNVMPLSEDQMMQKLFKDKNQTESIQRIKQNINSNHNDWQKTEKHDYYFAPPDFSIKHSKANWTIHADSIEIFDRNEYFVDKFVRSEHVYSMVVHRQSQFPLLSQTKKQIVFDNFKEHVAKSQGKINNLVWDHSDWSYDLPNSYVLDVDRFFYDWKFASVELYLIFDYLGLWLPTDVRHTIEQSWNVYRSLH